MKNYIAIHRKPILSVLVCALIVCLGTVGFFAAKKTSNAMDFESVLKLAVYNQIDGYMGAYLEDKNVKACADWSYGVITDTAEKNEVSISENVLEKTQNSLKLNFEKFFQSCEVETDNMGNVSELTKSYVANVVSTSLFGVDTSLSALQINTVGVDDLGEVDSMNGILDNITDAMSTLVSQDILEEPVPLGEDVNSALKRELNALETIVFALQDNVSHNQKSVAERIAGLEAQINSIDKIENNVSEIRDEASNETENFDGSEYDEKIASILKEIDGLKTKCNALASKYTATYVTDEQVKSILAEQNATINSTIKTNYETLYSSVAAANSDNAALQEKLNALMTSAVTKEELQTAINTVNEQLTSQQSNVSALQQTIVSVSSRISSLESKLDAYISKTNGELADIKSRLAALETSSGNSSAVTTKLIKNLVYGNKTSATSDLRNSIANNVSAFSTELNNVETTLNNLKAEYTGKTFALENENVSVANLLTLIDNALLKVQAAQNAVVDYGTTLTTRLDALDMSLFESTNDTADLSDAESQNKFVESASLFVGLQNAERAYYNNIINAVVEVDNFSQNVNSMVNLLVSYGTTENYVEHEIAEETANRIASDTAIIVDVEHTNEALQNEVNNRVASDTAIIGEINEVAEDLEEETENRIASETAIVVEIEHTNEALQNEINNRATSDAAIESSLRDLVSEQRSEVDTAMSEMETRINNAITGVSNGVAEDLGTIDDRLVAIESHLNVSRIAALTISSSDAGWVDNGNGTFTYRIENAEFHDASHVEIKYAEEPDEVPAYNGGEGYMTFTVSHAETLKFSSIFIYN